LEVDFVLDGVFFPAGAQEHAAAVFYHAWMTTEVSGGVSRGKIPNFNIFADKVVNAAEFAAPVGVVPGTADRGNVFQPGRFGGDFFQFIAIAKFVGVAGTLHAEEAMLAGHGCATFFPVLIQRANVADIGSNSGDGGEEQMIFSAAAEVESEAALGETAEEELGVFLHFVEDRRKFSLGNALDEKFEYGFVRRGGDRVGAFKALVAVFDAERGVLSGEIGIGAAGIDFQDEEVFSDFAAIEDAGGKEFVWTGDQESPQEIGCAI
jgi:hypothetical protein